MGLLAGREASDGVRLLSCKSSLVCVKSEKSFGKDCTLKKRTKVHLSLQFPTQIQLQTTKIFGKVVKFAPDLFGEYESRTESGFLQDGRRVSSRLIYSLQINNRPSLA